VDFTPGSTYLMPVAFGPLPPHPAGVFEDVRTLTAVFTTTPQAIARVLPAPFTPGRSPQLIAYMQRCRGVNFLAGGEYRLMGVNVTATFPAATGPIEGEFALILWETSIEAIIRGREILGIPKLLAEIDDPSPRDGRYRVTARENGADLMSLDLTGERAMTDAEVADLAAPATPSAWFGWKRIPQIDGVGVAVNQATFIDIANRPTAGTWCTGAVEFGDLTWQANPTSSRITAGLREFPLLGCERAYVTEGTVQLTRAGHRVLAEVPTG